MPTLYPVETATPGGTTDQAILTTAGADATSKANSAQAAAVATAAADATGKANAAQAAAAATAAVDATAKANAAQAAATSASEPAGSTAALQLKTKHALAAIAPVPHQKSDTDLVPLMPLAGGDDLATAGARYLAVRTSLLAHFAEVGTGLADGAHEGADGANGPGMGTDISSLAALITRIGEMKTAVVAHATEANVHFDNDATLAGLTLTTDPPVVQLDCNNDLNDFLAALQVHYAEGVEQVFA